MYGPVAKVGNSFRMPNCPSRIPLVAAVAGVRGRCRKPPSQSSSHIDEVDCSTEALVSHAAEFPIPANNRHPYCKSNVRVGACPYGALNAAECGYTLRQTNVRVW